jgi:hypothetical protein
MNATVNNETCAIEFHVIAGNGKPLLGRKSTTEEPESIRKLID